MTDRALLSVADARARILADVSQDFSTEFVPLEQALGRTLARNLLAARTQPPKALSAMDGYAVRAADLARLPVELKQIGESAAGHAYHGSVGPGETVRISTGAPLPDGSDTILIQENARVSGDIIEPLQGVTEGEFVRPRGFDFSEGDALLSAGTRLRATSIALAAAMNYKDLPVTQRPRVVILATGDELVRPGEAIGSDQIVASNSFGIAALVERAGGEPFDLGIAKDDLSTLEASIHAARAAEADLLVTLGGASVGHRDLVKPALARHGVELSFSQIAMRPGKPMIHGRLGKMAILGLPGNPVSAIVAGVLFLVPLVRALCGDPHAGKERYEAAVLGAAVSSNDGRQDFLRATLRLSETGLPVATPFQLQDSSHLRVLAEAQCLVIRDPHAGPAAAGDVCRIIRLDF
jgi:molybdopterin molybdotransferase